MSARSAVLGAITVADTAAHTLATCPAGMTVIVKDIRLLNLATVAQNIWVAVHRPPSISVYLLYGSVQASALESWQGWVILEPGDQLLCAIGQASATFWASGSVLSGTAPPTE